MAINRELKYSITNLSFKESIFSPYNDFKLKGIGSICWEGVTLIKGFVTCIFYVFISHPLLQIFTLTATHLIGINQPVSIQPCKCSCGNIVELCLSTIIFLLGIVNMIKAASETANFVPKGLNKSAI